MMTGGGYVADEIAEAAAVIELTTLLAHWNAAEAATKDAARIWLDDNRVRADTIAAALRMSRSTLYRWLRDRQVPDTPDGYAPTSP